MNRRGFLGVMLGAMAAPAIVRAESLMKIVVPKQNLELTPEELFKAMGWDYEPGQYSHHNWYASPFGPRPDRAVFPGYVMDQLHMYVKPSDSLILRR